MQQVPIYASAVNHDRLPPVRHEEMDRGLPGSSQVCLCVCVHICVLVCVCAGVCV